MLPLNTSKDHTSAGMDFLESHRFKKKLKHLPTHGSTSLCKFVVVLSSNSEQKICSTDQNQRPNLEVPNPSIPGLNWASSRNSKPLKPYSNSKPRNPKSLSLNIPEPLKPGVQRSKGTQGPRSLMRFRRVRGRCHLMEVGFGHNFLGNR